jgi:ribosomal protein S18 acetylase RimI-like enzyme
MTSAEADRWLARNLAGIDAWLRLIAASSPRASLIERDGVTALLNPSAPERSVFNSVVARRPDGLARYLDELEELYASNGCAWTVWLPEPESAELLAAAGHVLDAEPRAMGMALDGVEAAGLAGVEWSGGGTTRTMCEINDAAYGYRPGTWLRGMGEGDVGRVYIASIEGEPVSTAAAFDANDDCVITCVATLPEARGRGLAGGLVRQALVEARERGCATTTLQATKLGAPIYERIGYRDFGALQMWERRPPELAGA